MLSISIRNEAAYRADFLMRVFTSVLHFCGELLVLWTIFSNTKRLAGWSPAEVVVLLGVFRVMIGLIASLIAPNMRRIMEDIRNGALDFALLKPVSAQFYLSVRSFTLWRATDIVLGIALMVGGLMNLGRPVRPAELLASFGAFCVMLAAGATVVYSIWLALATSVFWFTRISNIEMVFWNVFEAGRYPVDIYQPWIRWGLTFIVPLAFLTTFPAGALVGRATFGGVLISVLVSTATLLAASAFWRFGLSRYSGASA